MKLVLAFLIGCSFLIGSVSAISITSPQIELGSFFSNGTHTTYSAKTSSNSIGYINIQNVSFNNYNINRAYIDVQVDSYYSAWFDHHQSTAVGRRTTLNLILSFITLSITALQLVHQPQCLMIIIIS